MKPFVMISTLLMSLVMASPASGDTAGLDESLSGTRSYQATAYELEGDEVLYVERHVETWLDGRLTERQVTYEDARGEVFADKEVVYGENPVAPSFEMIDYRSGLIESAEVGAEKVELLSGNAGDRPSARSIEIPESAVIDAGFDAFMRENFDLISAGNQLDFEFAVPAARRFFKFQLEPQGRVTYAGQEAVGVKMKPSNILLRLALDPVDLVYDLDGRLLEYRGLSNVADAEGDRYETRIVFDYADAADSSRVAEIGSVAR